MMSQVLSFGNAAAPAGPYPRAILRRGDAGACWMEATCGPSNESIPADPANAPGRVLSEALAVLAAAAVLAVAATQLFPGPMIG
ncbi:MAG TPA: hypothetical protein VGB91_04335 [Rhizomicrobium sp.]